MYKTDKNKATPTYIPSHFKVKNSFEGGGGWYTIDPRGKNNSTPP